jgi:hypothetical protein
VPIFAMSKRQRAESPPSSAAKVSRILHPTRKIVCQLPPTCHIRPTFLGQTSQLESHYATCHAHVCEETRCGAIFPERRLLDLVSRLDSFLLILDEPWNVEVF